MNVGWICATADMVKCLLPADVLEQAKADIRKVRTSNKGENSNHILKAYHVTVHARPRSGGADTVPCRVALLPYCRPASNGAAWHLSRLQELREQLQLPCGGRVRVVREVRQDNTIALVVEPEGRLDGAESAGAAQERGGRGVHGRTAAEGAGGAGTIKEEQDGGSRPGVRRRLTYGEGAAQGAGTSGQGGEGGGNETELDTDDSDVMFMEERSGGARGGDGQPPEVLAQAGGGEQSGGRVQGQAGGYRRAAAARRQAGAEALRRIRTCVGDESSDSGSNGTEEGGEDTDEDYSGSDDGAVGAASAEAARGGHGPDGPGNGRIRFSIIGLSIKTVRQLWPSSFGEDGKPRQSEVAVEVWAATGLPKASSVGQHDGAAAAGAGPSAQGQAPRALRRYPMRLRFSHHVIYLAGCPALTKDLAITDNNSAMLTRLPDGRVLVERRAQRRGRSGVDYPQRQACEAPAPCSAQGASGGHTVGGGDSGSVGRLVQSQLHLPQATKGKLLPDVEEGQHVDFFAVPCSTQAGEQVAASGGPAEGTGSGAAAGGTAAAGSDPTRYGPFTLLLKNCGHWYFNAAQPLWQCFGQRSGILCLSRLPDGPEGRARVLAEWMGSGGEPSPAPHAAEAAHNSRAAEPYAVDLVAARLAAGHGQEGAHGGAVAGQHRVEQQGNEQGGVAVRGGIAGEKRRDGGTGPGAPQAGMGQQQLQATKRRRATSEGAHGSSALVSLTAWMLGATVCCCYALAILPPCYRTDGFKQSNSRKQVHVLHPSHACCARPGGIPLAEPPTDLTRSGPAPGTAAAICDRKLRLCYTRIGVGILPWFLQARDILPRTRAAMQAQQQGQQEHAAGSGAGLLPSGTAANEGVAVHRVRLFVRQGHVRKCFLVALRQKQGSSSELSCPEPVRAALGPGVSYGTAIQLLRCVGEGGVVEVELRLRPEQQGGDGLGAAEAVEGQRGAGPAAVPTERLFGARAPAAEAAEGPNVQVHEGAGPAAVQLLQEYTAPTSAEARGQQGRDVGLSAACTQGRQEGQVGPSAAEVQRQQGGQGGSKAAWETAQQAAHGTAECTTRGGGVLQAAGQVQGGAGADLQCEVRSWAGTARDAGLQGGGPLPVGEALCASGDGAGTSAAVQPAHTAGGPMQQLQIPGDGMDAHLQAPILPQPQPSMEEEQPRQPTGPGQCAEAGQLNAWHRPAACLVRQQVQPQGPPQHPQVPPVHRQAQAGSPQAPLLPPHLPPVQQQGPHAQQQVPLAQQRAPQQPASNPVQQPQVPPVQPRGQGGHPLAQPEQLQAPPPGQQQTVAGTTFAEGGQAANTTTALPPVGRGGAVEAESQVRPEQQLGSAGPTAAEADGIGAAQGGQRVGREGQEYEQIGVTALEQQEQEQGGEGRAPSGQQLARSAVQHAALDPPAGLAQLPLAPAHQGPPARPVQQQAPAVQPQEPPVLPQAQGEQRLADQGQQGAPAQPPPAQGLPASRLSPATLCGYVASEEQLPPVREGDGELRRCGLTFHPDLALGVRAAMDAWQEGLGPGGLAETDPSTQQLYVGELGEDVLEVHRTWAQQHPHVEAALQEGQAVLQEQNLDPEQVADGVASLLGWSAKWDQEWPQGRVEMEGVEPFGGAAGERRGLRATAHIARSSVIGVASGYVMPADVSRTFVSRGFQFCSAEVRAELDRRAGRDVTPAWRVLAWSYMTGYSGGEASCRVSARALLQRSYARA